MDLVDMFFLKMLEFFPSTKKAYEESIVEYGERMEILIIEDIFMPELIELLRKNENKELLTSIFKYFEEISCCKNEFLRNIFEITILEILGNDRETLMKAQEYMGLQTTILQNRVDIDLGRTVH